MTSQRIGDARRAGSLGRIVPAIMAGLVALGIAAIVAVASDASAPVLVLWHGVVSPATPDWVGLHRFEAGELGLLSAQSAALSDAAAEPLGSSDDAARYLLVPSSLLEQLALGELPPAWQVALDDDARAAATPALLQSIHPLAGDAAQALIRLPDALAAVADAPGGRSQRLFAAPSAPSAPSLHATDATEPALPRLDEPARVDLWDALTPAVSADRMFADMDYLSTTLQTRYSYSPQIFPACDYVKAQFEALGLETYLDPYTIGSHSVENVVGVKPGTVDPSIIYIIGAHLDSTSPDAYNTAPGAEDNGSGSASVIEAARLLASLDCDYTIYFICFTGEEQGLRGSEHFAAEAQQQGLDIRGVLNLDMVGYYDPADEDLWLEGFRTGTNSTWLMGLVQANANRYAGLTVYQYSGDGWGSDHVPFHDHGYAAICALEYEWDSYPCYHRTCDTVSWLDGWLWSRITAAHISSLAQLAGLHDDPGAIDGQVTMPGGRGVFGTRVRLVDTEYPVRVSGIEGEFSWTGIFPGTYTLVTEADGFEPDTVAVTIASAQTTPVALELQPVPGSGVAEIAPSPGGASLSASPTLATAGTQLRLTLASTESGSLSVYAPDGRLVRRVYSPGALPAGESTFTWNARDEAGRDLVPGVYWVRWQGARSRAEQAVVVLR
jgi:hypothetical protein